MNENGDKGGGDDVLRAQVRSRYERLAETGGCCSGVGGSETSCCGGSGSCGPESTASNAIGYSGAELSELPHGADLGLGCGNPTAFATLQPGETVLDLGSGAGIDCFLAAKRVGQTGGVIGVDMTPAMVDKARGNARTGGYANVEFRLGEIEHLPVSDRTVDVVVSNCVINLAVDKRQVYREAFRVLKPGGRLAISDVVATRPIRPEERADPALWCSCSSGALAVDELREILKDAGFQDIRVARRTSVGDPASLEDQASMGIRSASIQAVRPVEG